MKNYVISCKRVIMETLSNIFLSLCNETPCLKVSGVRDKQYVFFSVQYPHQLPPPCMSHDKYVFVFFFSPWFICVSFCFSPLLLENEHTCLSATTYVLIWSQRRFWALGLVISAIWNCCGFFFWFKTWELWLLKDDQGQNKNVWKSIHYVFVLIVFFFFKHDWLRANSSAFLALCLRWLAYTITENSIISAF